VLSVSTTQHSVRGRDDEGQLTADLIELARQYSRYGYRKIAALLRDAGWIVNDKRVERIWRREGLKVPAERPKRGRLWLTDGSCIRLRPERQNHVWSYDFVEDRTHNGRKFRMLNVVDEFAHECLAIRVARKLKADDVIDVLTDLFILRGRPEHVRSDNGPRFVAKSVRAWITGVGTKTAYIAPGSPGRMALWRASTPACATNCWTAKSFKAYGKRRSSLRAGDATTTPFGRMPRWATDRPRSRRSRQRLPLGRLRSPDRLRRPSYLWRQNPP
jgi:hypothetical protein